MEKTVMSKRDVIVCRGIWYIMALLSLFGLSISLNLLWPPGGKSSSSSSSSSRFLRDGAVSATTFYAVTLVRYLFFTDPPSTNFYEEFTTVKERIPQLVFAELALCASYASAPICTLILEDREVSFVLYVSLFTISLFTGRIGLIQLSDNFRMEMRHAYFTLFSCWFCCLYGIITCIFQNLVVNFCFMFVYLLLCSWILLYNLGWEEGLHTSSASPLHT